MLCTRRASRCPLRQPSRRQDAAPWDKNRTLGAAEVGRALDSEFQMLKRSTFTRRKLLNSTCKEEKPHCLIRERHKQTAAPFATSNDCGLMLVYPSSGCSRELKLCSRRRRRGQEAVYGAARRVDSHWA